MTRSMTTDDAGMAGETGRIVRLEIDSFKSYKGAHLIGPFKNFTAIIGPNGSGKSNLMDAISFVLGVRTQHLRGNLRDLLYYHADSTDPSDRPTRGSVKLVYETPDGEEIHFARMIHPSSGGGGDVATTTTTTTTTTTAPPPTSYASTYRIDDKTVSFEAYTQRLESIGILVKARNFLVFQGDIEAVAQKSPREVTELIETIAGTDALRRQYDELATTKTRAEEVYHALFSKKKRVTQEKKMKKEQSEEAAKVLAMRDEYDALRLESYLWKLYQQAVARVSLASQVAELEKDMRHHARSHLVTERALDEKRKALASVQKQVLLLEKKLATRRKEADKRNPHHVKHKEELLRLKKKVADHDKALAKLMESKTKSDAERENLTVQREAIQSALADFETTVREAAASHPSLQLSKQDQAEYYRLSADVTARVARLKAEKEVLERGLESDRDKLVAREDVVREMDSRVQLLGTMRNEVRERFESLTRAVHEAEEAVLAKQAEVERAEGESQKCQARRVALQRIIADSEGRLAEAKSEKRETDRMRRMADGLKQLQRVFPGCVFGRLADISEMQNLKYATAVTVALGKENESIIVDTEQTARDCIEYLKSQQIGCMTFLPLDSIQTKPILDVLRHVGGTAKLCIDLVKYDAKFERAFLYALGNTLVCDSLDEARRLAYSSGRERKKVVTLDGTLFAKTGLVTGGVSESGQGGNRWDERRLEACRLERQRASQELLQLPSTLDLESSAAKLRRELTTTESTLTTRRAELSLLQDRRNALETDLAALSTERKKLLPELKQLRDVVGKGEVEVKKLLTRMHAVHDEVFKTFSRKLGITNIREHEETTLKRERETLERRASLQQQLAKVEAQLDYMANVNETSDALQRRQEEKKRDEASLAKLKRVAEEEEKKATGEEEEMKEWVASLRKLERQVEDGESEVATLKGEASKRMSEGQKKERERALLAAQEEAAGERIEELLREAEVEGVELPRLEGGGGGGEGGGKKKKKGKAVAQEEEEDEEEEEGGKRKRRAAGAAAKRRRAQDINDEEEEEEEEEEPLAASKDAFDYHSPTHNPHRIDFSPLRREFRRPTPPSTHPREHEAILREFSTSLEALSAAIQSAAPNMKAMEQLEALKTRERQQNEALEAARRASQAAADSFHQVKQKRLEEFMEAYEHISHAIDPIYKELTRSVVSRDEGGVGAATLGGTASLALENADEPFLHGVKFTAMPPSKRFRDMDQLSGGERTVAALALLFAIHSFRPSPFFVLDEVDAALDAANVGRVATYIREKSRAVGAPGNFQTIVISLKDTFFDRADALVGVTKEFASGVSKTLTFDLDRYAL